MPYHRNSKPCVKTDVLLPGLFLQSSRAKRSWQYEAQTGPDMIRSKSSLFICFVWMFVGNLTEKFPEDPTLYLWEDGSNPIGSRSARPDWEVEKAGHELIGAAIVLPNNITTGF